MIFHKKCMLAALGLGFVASVAVQARHHQRDPFIHMNNLFQEMFEQIDQIHQMHKQVQEQFDTLARENTKLVEPKKWYNQLNINEDAQAVTLQLTEVATNGVEAGWQEEENQLTIDIDGAQIRCAAQDGVLLISLEKSLQEHVTQEQIKSEESDEQDAVQASYNYVSFCQESYAQSFNGKIKLEDAQVNYNTEAKIVTITLPKEVKVAKKIAVTIS